MRVPGLGYRAKKAGCSEGTYSYDKSVYRCFRQLRDMPNLKRLEISIPWRYEFLNFHSDSTGADKVHCACPAEEVLAMSPEDRIWHTIQGHSSDREYWDLLADLKENAASDELTIALVIMYGPWEWVEDPEAVSFDPEAVNFWASDLRQSRWISAYAALMGYEFGHTWWEDKGPRRGSYRVRYDKDRFSVAISESQEEGSLLEPPELPKDQEGEPAA